MCPTPKKRSWPSFERESSEGTFSVLVVYCRDAPRVDVLPLPQSTIDPADVEKLKKSNKSLTKQVKMMMRLFRSDKKFSQMLNQFESSPEFRGTSGSDRCGDDKPGGDEDGDEDQEDQEDQEDVDS
ncbi:hypothetical protein Tco_1536813 [Tanacetum coccineum]